MGLPIHLEFPAGRCAVPEVEVDQGLIRDVQLLGQALEVVHRRLIQAQRRFVKMLPAGIAFSDLIEAGPDILRSHFQQRPQYVLGNGRAGVVGKLFGQTLYFLFDREKLDSRFDLEGSRPTRCGTLILHETSNLCASARLQALQ